MPSPHRGAGQASVETALVLPFVAALLLTLVQVGLVARDQILVIHAAREGARAAAVDPHPRTAHRAAAEGAPLRSDRIRVETTTSGDGSRVRVGVSYRSPTDVPLVGGLVGDIPLTAAVTMRIER